MIIKKGTSISSGITFGKCYRVDRNKVFITGRKITDNDAEIAKLRAAVSHASGVIDCMQYVDVAGKINAELYEAYKMLLEDEQFIGRAETIIREDSVNAEFALKLVRDKITKTILASESPYLREKVHDIDNIYQRIQRHMLKIEYDEFENAGSDAIIIARDVITSDIPAMVGKGIKGFATNFGSKLSHNSIIAKTAGLIAVVGLGDIYDSVSDGDDMILDSFLGHAIINPDAETIKRYEKKRDDYNNFLSSFKRSPDTSCRMKDGTEVSLYANVESNDELTLIDVHGLEGVGLYRTEFIFMNKFDMSENEQYTLYSNAAKTLKGKRLTMRSFDLGGDKVCREMMRSHEQNPAMGLRAIRYSLKNEDMFCTQLRAILRAAHESEIRLLLPMVSSVDELLTVKTLLQRECGKLSADGICHRTDIKLGIMVELPSTALSINKFLPHTDFFSIGTNDLIQFLLGFDRGNEEVSHIYSPAHHAVLTLLKQLYGDIKGASKEVSICGELAGDCRYTAMLIGMGYRSFSMNPRSSYVIRRVISKLTTSDCEELLANIECATTVKDAEDVVTRFNNVKLKDIIM